MAARKREDEVFPNAAGTDIGASSHWVDVPPYLADDAVREFGPMTADLNALAGRFRSQQSFRLYWTSVLAVTASGGKPAPYHKGFLIWLETRMDKRSSRGMAGEWRKQWLSGQAACRTPIGAAFRGGDYTQLAKSACVLARGCPYFVLLHLFPKIFPADS
jgi:hypothetical protein